MNFLLLKSSSIVLNKTKKLLVVAALSIVSSPSWACDVDAAYGTYCRLFSNSSPWNIFPVHPTFTSIGVPASTMGYFPSVSGGAYSTGIFKAEIGDPSATVYGLTSSGVWFPDAQAYRTSVTLPRWPAEVAAASGSDGHADIVDEASGIIHSFWKLKKVGGVWKAQQYAWTSLKGRGWGEPAQYFQGARAAAVPTSGGVIRKHEVDDGDVMYRHALAMSLAHNGLAKSPTYVYPATSADSDAASTNSGKIPEGALLMLPPDFDIETIKTPALKKVARTLQVYGGRVVDRNTGTPYVIYVEIGANFALHAGGWNSVAASDLQRIRVGLRMLDSAKSWVSGATPAKYNALWKGVEYNGWSSINASNLNHLSMRGPWSVSGSGSTSGSSFDTWQQAYVWKNQNAAVLLYKNDPISKISWAVPKVDDEFVAKARVSGGAKVRFEVIVGSKVNGSCVRNTAKSIDTGYLVNGQSYKIKWPSGVCMTRAWISKPSGSAAANATAAIELLK
ncbi:MAG: hypothetical protein AAGB31_13610 [Bdellovibrio sp.]